MLNSVLSPRLVFFFFFLVEQDRRRLTWHTATQIKCFYFRFYAAADDDDYKQMRWFVGGWSPLKTGRFDFVFAPKVDILIYDYYLPAANNFKVSPHTRAKDLQDNIKLPETFIGA